MITIFTTETCAFCLLVEKFLDRKGVKYVTEDVTDGKHIGYRQLAKLYGANVPLIYDSESDRGITGYNIAQLNELIKGL